MDTHVNMYNVYSVTLAVTHLSYSRREMHYEFRGTWGQSIGGVEAATGVESDVSKWSRSIALVAPYR